MGSAKKGLDSLFILGACLLWKHRNKCVFDAAPLNLAVALMQVGEERLGSWPGQEVSPPKFSSR
jgi:hypothetical protein